LSRNPIQSSSRTVVSKELSAETMPHSGAPEKPPGVDAGPLASLAARGQEDTHPGAVQAGAGAETADSDADDGRRPSAAAAHPLRARRVGDRRARDRGRRAAPHP